MRQDFTRLETTVITSHCTWHSSVLSCLRDMHTLPFGSIAFGRSVQKKNALPQHFSKPKFLMWSFLCFFKFLSFVYFFFICFFPSSNSFLPFFIQTPCVLSLFKFLPQFIPSFHSFLLLSLCLSSFLHSFLCLVLSSFAHLIFFWPIACLLACLLVHVQSVPWHVAAHISQSVPGLSCDHHL